MQLRVTMLANALFLLNHSCVAVGLTGCQYTKFHFINRDHVSSARKSTFIEIWTKIKAIF